MKYDERKRLGSELTLMKYDERKLESKTVWCVQPALFGSQLTAQSHSNPGCRNGTQNIWLSAVRTVGYCA